MDHRLLGLMRQHEEKMRTAFDDPRITPDRRALGEAVVRKVIESRADAGAIGLDYVLHSFHVVLNAHTNMPRADAVVMLTDSVMSMFQPEAVLSMLAEAVWRLHGHGDRGDELASDKATLEMERLLDALRKGTTKK